ncbi:MAG: 3-hydroxyanthranilate 3,4-dioxygenase [Planctomycetota bacterium]
MQQLAAFNLKRWIEDNRHLLKPPVGNKLVWENADFIVMIVGGPNQRKDYHINPTEEFFHQLEGNMVLKVIQDGKPRDIAVNEGDVFLLPPGIPHSPQRGPNTVGMVVERRRPADKNDQVVFICDNCRETVHRKEFYCTNLGLQLKPVIEEFWSKPELRKCKKCGAEMQQAQPK